MHATELQEPLYSEVKVLFTPMREVLHHMSDLLLLFTCLGRQMIHHIVLKYLHLLIWAKI